MKIFELRWKSYWNTLPQVELSVIQHWFSKWLGPAQPAPEPMMTKFNDALLRNPASVSLKWHSHNGFWMAQLYFTKCFSCIPASHVLQSMEPVDVRKYSDAVISVYIIYVNLWIDTFQTTMHRQDILPGYIYSLEYLREHSHMILYIKIQRIHILT